MSFFITVVCEPYDVFLCKLFSGGFVEISGKLTSNGCFEKYKKSLVIIKPRRVRDESHVNREIQYIRFEKYNTVGYTSAGVAQRNESSTASDTGQCSGRPRPCVSQLALSSFLNFKLSRMSRNIFNDSIVPVFIKIISMWVL